METYITEQFGVKSAVPRMAYVLEKCTVQCRAHGVQHVLCVHRHCVFGLTRYLGENSHIISNAL